MFDVKVPVARARRFPLKAARTLVVSASDDYLVLYWANEGIISKNWGDKLNPVLARMISGKNVVHALDVFPRAAREIHYVIGSSLEHAQLTGGIVWGVGFIKKSQGLKTAPRAVHAVRGYLSMGRLRELGIACPEVVGDPALLLPRWYTPKPAKRRYKLGIIPHCFELGLPAVAPANLPEDVLVIDITDEIFKVVDQINACDFIASSSLHGLICADSYGVPSRWIWLSDKPVGDGFKYHDYYSSVGWEVDGPLRVSAAADFANVRDGHRTRKIEIDLDRLVEACPFLPP